MFLLQLVLFQVAEEIGFTGFLQHHWQDRYHPLKLTLYVALLWAVWHMPDHFAVEGWGIQALISAPVVFAIEVVSLFSARAIFVWFYNRTGSSVLLVAIFHASFDAAINQGLLRRSAGNEHDTILDLQRRNRSFSQQR
jgi:CAAX protease family protein